MRTASGLVIFAFLLTSACTPEDDPSVLRVDPSDGRTVWWHDFIVEPNADFQRLATQELAWVGPFQGADGQQRISMFTTGAHAASLAPFGFRAERRRQFDRQSRDGEVGAVSAALGCSEPSVSPCPDASTLGSSYLLTWSDIQEELLHMDTEHGDITTLDIGSSWTGSNDIVAVQFGPLEPIENPPTIYIVAGYHAREWIGSSTALYLARWLRDTIVDPLHDLILHSALYEAAVVVVPIVNPDGYEATWNGQRMRRNNSNSACVDGVDLNRNHLVTWGEAAGGSSPTCVPGDGTWIGLADSAGNRIGEPETIAMEALFTGGAFAPVTGVQTPAAIVSYHSFANMVIYPDGYSRGGPGPDCGLLEQLNNCFNPDFPLLRHLFGDTHHAFGANPFFFDDGSPYYRDHGSSLLYGVSGDTGLHATYHPETPVVAITPELASDCFGFQIECHPDPDRKIEEVGEQQVRLLRRLVQEAPELTDSTEATAFGPNTVGTYASGIWTREYRESGPDEDSARATFTKAVFRPVSTGTLVGTVDGVDVTYQPGRAASHYDLYFLDHEAGGFDPRCLPCYIQSGAQDEGESADGTLCDGECVSLCDEGRLDTDGWVLQHDEENRNCWWEPAGSEVYLEHPHQSGWTTLDPDPSHCHFTFSARWAGVTAATKVVLERESTSGGWEELWRIPYEDPFNDNPSVQPNERMISFAYEANTFLPDDTPAFRFRLLGDPPTEFRLFDPVIYCRLGGLPR